MRWVWRWVTAFLLFSGPVSAIAQTESDKIKKIGFERIEREHADYLVSDECEAYWSAVFSAVMDSDDDRDGWMVRSAAQVSTLIDRPEKRLCTFYLTGALFDLDPEVDESLRQSIEVIAVISGIAALDVKYRLPLPAKQEAQLKFNAAILMMQPGTDVGLQFLCDAYEFGLEEAKSLVGVWPDEIDCLQDDAPAPFSTESPTQPAPPPSSPAAPPPPIVTVKPAPAPPPPPAQQREIEAVTSPVPGYTNCRRIPLDYYDPDGNLVSESMVMCQDRNGEFIEVTGTQ